jgi:glycosyltransferase involved in cell wall biosynthesis
MTQIDVVIPVYQSEITTKSLIERLNNWANQTGLSPHFIFVNDGSLDKTLQVLKKHLKNTSLSYSIISLAKNYGQHTATAIGFYYSKNNLIATIDDDLQHDPSVIDDMYECMKTNENDLIYGNYTEKKHPFLRNIGTKSLQQILKLEGKDYSMVTSCRLIKSSVISVFKINKRRVFFVDDYLLLGAVSVKSCMVDHSERTSGQSGYTIAKLTKMAFTILMLHSTLPLRVISRMGLYMSIVFFILGCLYIYKKIAFDVEIGFTSLIVAIFFSTGLILFSLGIIGEYIRRIWISKQDLDMIIIADQSSSELTN